MKQRNNTRHRAQVADRLEAAVNTALDQGFRTKDIYQEGKAGDKLIKCSALGDKLVEFL